MQKKKLFSMLAVLAVGFMFIACDGDAGPEGPKGDSGAVGATGPKGAQGDKGDTGAQGADGSSVISVANFTGGLLAEGIGQSIIVNNSQLPFAQAISSVILVYLQNATGDWYRVPGPATSTNGVHTFAMSLHNVSGQTQIRVTRTNGSGSFQFAGIRLVSIKSSTNARQNAVDYDSYEAVRQYYNLAD